MTMALPKEYDKLLQMSRGKKKENKIFFEKLKKLRPKDLDVVTNEYHYKAFEKIDCLKCANCCSTTGPLLRNKDIQVLADDMKLRQADFTEKFLRTDEEGDFVFKSLP